RRLIEQILCDGVARGELRDDLDPTLTSLAIVGMCNWMHRWYRPTGKVPAAAIADTFATLVLDGLRPSGVIARSADVEVSSVG
ncbi:MAG TPA: hypothetical protein VHL09_08875, partial [Dehalococcoidia bacterium]|nr:hypothetical protein [Dehalococcoidia bacterium]